MLANGSHGHLAVSHAAEEAKTGKGANDKLPLLSILLLRGKIAGATNNGTRCASARTIPLTETDTCNVVECPPGIIILN